MKHLLAAASLLVLAFGSVSYAQTASSANPEAQTYGNQPPNIEAHQSGDKSIPYNMTNGVSHSDDAAGASADGTSGSSMPPAKSTMAPSGAAGASGAVSSGNPTNAPPKVPNH